MRCFPWVQCLTVVLAAGACGQSPDVVGDRNDLPPPPEDTGWETEFEACATQREEAALVPTNLFLAIDKSCSMGNPADGSTTGTTTGTVTKWDITINAFTSFFEDPASSTLDAALRLWPSPDGCNDTLCDPVVCSAPSVPLDSVGDPAHQQALIDALVATEPEGGTPMHAALDGAVRWATAQLAATPEEQVAIVLVTDGEPNGCDEDMANIASLAASAAAAGVPVYAVGIEGSNVAQMDQIAAAGGTGAGYFVGTSDAEAELLAVLIDIQGQVVSCRFAFPTGSGGEPLSPDLVRLEYTAEDGEVVLVGRVADAAACGTQGGWYLDDPDDPTTLTLCDTTCTDLQGVETVAIEIDVGCECTSDADCPGQDVCSPDGCVAPCDGPECGGISGDGVSVVGRQAVQGGALNCATVGGEASLALLLATLLVARVRREAL